MPILEGTPFARTSSVGDSALLREFNEIDERVRTLRRIGTLSEATLRDYYGRTRFEQVAESNAIEGSTLDVGETQLAILKGVTVLGHDPRYVQDARALNLALTEVEALAKEQKPIDILEVKRVHELVLAGQADAGDFRSKAVIITGSKHEPPADWHGVMEGMEEWERWSAGSVGLPTLFRVAVLHAWFVYVHPFRDGNGRTARALSTLDLVRAGYPPFILRKSKDRDRYIDALEAADFGDLRELLELLLDREEDAIRDLERAAARQQGYDALVERERRAFEHRVTLWELASSFLYESILARLEQLLLGSEVELVHRRYQTLLVDDFRQLSKGERVSQSWAFMFRFRSKTSKHSWLAWTDTLGDTLARHLGSDASRPSLRWSIADEGGSRAWRLARAEESPYAIRMTFAKDRWLVVTSSGVESLTPTELAERIADAMVGRLVPSDEL
jgi:Fic family protein